MRAEDRIRLLPSNAQRDREDEELRLLRVAFDKVPGASFVQNKEGRWYWKDASMRIFLRKLGYHEILDAMEIVAAHHFGLTVGPTLSEAVWRYLCGVCWRRIKEPERFA